MGADDENGEDTSQRKGLPRGEVVEFPPPIGFKMLIINIVEMMASAVYISVVFGLIIF